MRNRAGYEAARLRAPAAARAGTIHLWLWALLGLFALRVLAQLIQGVAAVDWLPSFIRWDSGTLPYGALLGAQLVIALVMLRLALQVSRGTLVPKPAAARLWLSVAVVYGVCMACRLNLGLTIFTTHRWFTSHLPTLFHFVLAGFVLAVGLYHRRGVELHGGNRNVTR